MLETKTYLERMAEELSIANQKLEALRKLIEFHDYCAKSEDNETWRMRMRHLLGALNS